MSMLDDSLCILCAVIDYKFLHLSYTKNYLLFVCTQPAYHVTSSISFLFPQCYEIKNPNKYLYSVYTLYMYTRIYIIVWINAICIIKIGSSSRIPYYNMLLFTQ